MTLNGETGTEKGHPLVANPSFCAPQTIDVLFQGYEFNSVDGIFQGDDAIPGHGDGKIVDPPVRPLPSNRLRAIPYAPTFAASADTEASGAHRHCQP